VSSDNLREQFDNLRGQISDDPWARAGLIAAANHALDDQGCRGLLRDEDVIAVAIAVLRQHNAWLMLLPGEVPGEAFNTGARATMLDEARP
jgi:hypothetical protein